jgi:hypothetical protein
MIVAQFPAVSATATGKDAVQSAVDSMAEVKSAASKSRPSLIFVSSKEQETPKVSSRKTRNSDQETPDAAAKESNKKSADEKGVTFEKGVTAKKVKDLRTRQARESEELFVSLFQNPADPRIGVVTKFFRCVGCDVTEVAKANHPVVNRENAPLVILTDAAGKVVEVIPAGRITSAGLFSRMIAILRAEGVKDCDQVLNSLLSLMGDLRKAEEALAVATAKNQECAAELEKARKKYAKKAKGGEEPPPAIKTAEQALERAKPQLETAKKVQTDIYAKEKEILSAAKAPEWGL